MSQLNRNQSILHKYIPEKAVPIIAEWVYKYDFKLRVKKSRASKYGDYRPPAYGKNHLITINYDLNKYAFLITLVHEIAHLVNYNTNKSRVKPHGIEWKHHYKLLIQPFLFPDIFPADVIEELSRYMRNPAASSCSDIDLLRVLKKYDANQDTILLEDVPLGETFKFNKNRYFVKGERVRKRYECKELPSNHSYLFNPLTEVLLAVPPKL